MESSKGESRHRRSRGKLRPTLCQSLRGDPLKWGLPTTILVGRSSWRRSSPGLLFAARLGSSLVVHPGHLMLQCTPTYWGLPGWCLVRLFTCQGHVPQSCVCGPHKLGGLQNTWGSLGCTGHHLFNRGPQVEIRGPARRLVTPMCKVLPSA